MPVLLCLSFPCRKGGISEACADDPASLKLSTVILPDAYLTLISPQQGLRDKAPELGAVYLPGSTDLLSGYLETGNGSGLSKLEEEYRAKSIAHVRSNDVAMEKQKWNCLTIA